MKKLFIVALGMVVLVACGGKKNGEKSPEELKIDSLNKANALQQQQMESIMKDINMVNDGLRAISEAEGRITMGDSTSEGHPSQQSIAENLQFIQDRMQANRDLIAQLKDKLNASTVNESVSSELASSLRKQIEDLEGKVTSQAKRIQELEKQLREKDAIIVSKDATINGQNEQINGLNGQVNNLTENVNNLNTEKDKLNGQVSKLNQDNTNLVNEVTKANADNEKKSETVAQQDKALNTAWYVFGTKAELKSQKILDKGEVLRNGNFSKEYFTKIDIRKDRSIPFYSKSAKLLTTHPASSYSLTKDSKGYYTLSINDPTTFWSVSKYLVVQVK